ncbi:MAG: tryptophanyl-tRNA synthetase TrpS [Rickettsiaceae bacterium]|jgi:tryptophanyl-tRNA synthetase|nr:tryptophanyl-tRNA synthetase TrpS [Rickettsiaceae bacterium]
MNQQTVASYPTIFSGIQPTGNLHLGNYLGSIANWIGMQNDNKCLFGIMDLHSITLPQNPSELRNNILETAIVYLASGIDPKKSIIFAQSAIKEHAELAWILGCLTPMGWLNRMTQFKEKSADNENLGLYAYPVLMASDILLYKANIVPVGEDQKQHLELARDIAGAFNRQFKTEFFKLPEPMILGNCTRVMSLQDGTKKMSKSDESDLSRINLSDDVDLIVKKIKKAKTDSEVQISYDKARPEIYNLLNIFSVAVNKKPEELALQYQSSGNGKFKEDLAGALVTMLEPIQKNIKLLKNDLGFVKKILADGEENARAIACENSRKIKEIVGLY